MASLRRGNEINHKPKKGEVNESKNERRPLGRPDSSYCFGHGVYDAPALWLSTPAIRGRILSTASTARPTIRGSS